MSRANLGEKGSISIETLYAYCSGTEEGGSSGVLKSVLDPMYPFFVFPEKKDEFAKKIKILINMYMLEQKQGVYTSKKCVWRAVGIEELKKYLENPNGCIIYGPNSFSRSASAVRNYIKNPEYSTGENKAIIKFRYNGKVLDVNATINSPTPNEEEVIISGEFGSLIVKEIKRKGKDILSGCDLYEAILEDNIPVFESKEKISEAWEFYNNYQNRNIINPEQYKNTETTLRKPFPKQISCPEAINLYRRGIITKDVFQNPELQKWLDSMRKFLDLMYMKAQSRVKDSEISGKPIKELNTYDERY